MNALGSHLTEEETTTLIDFTTSANFAQLLSHFRLNRHNLETLDMYFLSHILISSIVFVCILILLSVFCLLYSHLA